MVEVQMSDASVTQFIESLSEAREKIRLFTRLDLIEKFEEPTQTVGFTANLVPVAFSGPECCMDFYQLSPFMRSTMEKGGTDAIQAEPVVRVSLPTGLFHAMVHRLEELCPRTVVLEEVQRA
jgi:hypothetical protein